jgi:hypothetical protein
MGWGGASPLPCTASAMAPTHLLMDWGRTGCHHPGPISVLAGTVVAGGRCPWGATWRCLHSRARRHEVRDGVMVLVHGKGPYGVTVVRASTEGFVELPGCRRGLLISAGAAIRLDAFCPKAACRRAWWLVPRGACGMARSQHPGVPLPRLAADDVAAQPPEAWQLWRCVG